MKIVIDAAKDLEGDDILAYIEGRPELVGRGGTPEAAIGRLIVRYKLELKIEIEVKQEAQDLFPYIW